MWMLNTLRYISIGLYMPMFGLLAAGFLFTTLGLWFKLLAEQNDNKVRTMPGVGCQSSSLQTRHREWGGGV